MRKDTHPAGRRVSRVSTCSPTPLPLAGGHGQADLPSDEPRGADPHSSRLSQGHPRPPAASQPAPAVSLGPRGKQMHTWSSECEMFVQGSRQWKLEREESGVEQGKASDHDAEQTDDCSGWGGRTGQRASDHDPPLIKSQPTQRSSGVKCCLCRSPAVGRTPASGALLGPAGI